MNLKDILFSILFATAFLCGCNDKNVEQEHRRAGCYKSVEAYKKIESLERELSAMNRIEWQIEKVDLNDVNNDGLSDIVIKFYDDYCPLYYLNEGNGKFKKSISRNYPDN